MAKLKTKTTAAGAQQYTNPKTGTTAARTVTKKLDKDIDKVHNDEMTRKEFKEKYDMSIREAIYLAGAAEMTAFSQTSDSRVTKATADNYEKQMVKKRKKIKEDNKNKGGLIKTDAKDYRKGGMFY